jgi:hypothetical protein
LFFSLSGIAALVYIFIGSKLWIFNTLTNGKIWVFVGLLLFLYLEFLTKLLIILDRSSIQKKFVLIPIDRWQDLIAEELDQLERWTNELIELGFRRIGDYEPQPSQKESCIARIFFNDEKKYFGVIFKIGNRKLFCWLLLTLEKGWSLTASNNSDLQLQSSIYVFQRLPRTLHKVSQNISPTELYHSLNSWRGELLIPLNVLEVANETAIDFFIAAESRGSILTRKRLLTRSITWLWVEYWWFKSHPQFEWLGDYAKLKS